MEKPKLVATKRAVTGKQVGQLRRAGKLPAVMYGKGVEPIALEMDAREASRVIRRVHGAQLLEVMVDGQTHNVLLQDLQRDSLKGHFLHADFYVVDMTQPIRVRLPIRLVGVSHAVNSLSGVLVHGITEVAVECLPADLIVAVELDMDPLKEIGDALYVRDLYLPRAIKVLSDPDELVARVTYQAKEEDLSTPVGVVTAEVEVIEKGKIEEEGEEGAEEY